MNKKKIEIQNGAMTRKLEADEGTTIGELKSKLGSKFSLSSDHQAYVTTGNGSPTAASDDTIIEDGMSINFTRNTGQKG